jgi:hypothetical protein
MAPAKSPLAPACDGGGQQFAEINALALIVVAELLQRAVDVERLVIARVTDQADDALRLAQRIDADQMRPVRIAG